VLLATRQRWHFYLLSQQSWYQFSDCRGMQGRIDSHLLLIWLLCRKCWKFCRFANFLSGTEPKCMYTSNAKSYQICETWPMKVGCDKVGQNWSEHDDMDVGCLGNKGIKAWALCIANIPTSNFGICEEQGSNGILCFYNAMRWFIQCISNCSGNQLDNQLSVVQ